MDSRKLLYAGGGLVGVILVAVVWSGLSGSSTSEALLGSSVLSESPLIIGSNFFLSNLKDYAQNNVSKTKFDHNGTTHSSVFGNINCSSCQTDIPKLHTGLVGSQIWSVKVPCAAMYKDAVALTLEQIDAAKRLFNKYQDFTYLPSSDRLMSAYGTSASIGCMLGLASSHSIDGRLAVLRTLQALGVRVMALTSNCSTAWAASYTNDIDNGLSDFGKAMVNEMNRVGILIDLSEASYKTQLDVLNVSKAPVVFTRAAAFSVSNNSRNIKDDVLEKLKENKGLLLVTFVNEFISNTTEPVTSARVIQHINYIKNKVGIDGVGIGAEFDAKNQMYPSDLQDVSEIPALFDKLAEASWNRDDLKKLAGGNLIRALKEVEKYAGKVSSQAADETYKLPADSQCYSDYADRNDKEATPTSKPPAPTEATVATTPTTVVPTTPAATSPTTQTPQTAAADKTKPTPKPDTLKLDTTSPKQ